MGSKSWIEQLYPIGHRGLFPAPSTHKLATANVIRYDTQPNGNAPGRVLGVVVRFDCGRTAVVNWIELNKLQIEGRQIDRFVEVAP